MTERTRVVIDCDTGVDDTMAIFYGLLTIMGFIPGLNTFFGLMPLFGADIGLHAVTALISAYFGWAAPVVAFERERDRVARV